MRLASSPSVLRFGCGTSGGQANAPSIGMLVAAASFAPVARSKKRTSMTLPNGAVNEAVAESPGSTATSSASCSGPLFHRTRQPTFVTAGTRPWNSVVTATESLGHRPTACTRSTISAVTLAALRCSQSGCPNGSEDAHCEVMLVLP